MSWWCENTAAPIKGKISSAVWPFSNNIISIFCNTSNDIPKQVCCCWCRCCCCCYCSGNCTIFLETITRTAVSHAVTTQIKLIRISIFISMPLVPTLVTSLIRVCQLPSVIQAISFRIVSFRLALVLFRFQCWTVVEKFIATAINIKRTKVQQHTFGNCTII